MAFTTMYRVRASTMTNKKALGYFRVRTGPIRSICTSSLGCRGAGMGRRGTGGGLFFRVETLQVWHCLTNSLTSRVRPGHQKQREIRLVVLLAPKCPVRPGEPPRCACSKSSFRLAQGAKIEKRRGDSPGPFLVLGLIIKTPENIVTFCFTNWDLTSMGSSTVLSLVVPAISVMMLMHSSSWL